MRTRTLTIDRVPSISLRDGEGNVLKTTHDRCTTISRQGRTFVELCTPVKLYVGVDGFVEVHTDHVRTTLDFGERRPVHVGARVKHDRPECSVTTTESITDVFRAVSTFGRVDQPTGPERSFQSYRRHPPKLTIGSQVDIPDALETGNQRLQIEVPATYTHAAIAAPLAYYLSADVVPGHPPGLRLDGEYLQTWDDDASLDRRVAQLLQRVFFLDCLARREHSYDVTVQGRDALGNELDLAWADVAELPLGDRVRRYLSLPTAPIDAQLPAWSARAHVVPNRHTLEALPYLAYDLLPVRRASEAAEQTDPPATSATALDHNPSGPPRPGDGSLIRQGFETALSLGTDDPVGSDGVVGAALRNRSARDDQNDAISVTVVCNDPRMLQERDSVESIYDTLAISRVDVRCHEELTVDELTTVLSTPTDYLHYIGHIRSDGFKCSDGSLSIADGTDIGAEVFFLNACRSQREGKAMIAQGAVGGIATERPVGNHGATAVGRTIAELLIRGYPLGAALTIAQDHHAMCRDYSVIGDPRIEIADTESGLPYLCAVRPDSEGYLVELRTVLTTSVRKGSLASFHLGEDQTYSLNPTVRRYHVDQATLQEFLDFDRIPVRWDGSWLWSDEAQARLAERA